MEGRIPPADLAPFGMADLPERPDVEDATRPDLDLVAEAEVLGRTGDLVPIPKRSPAADPDADIRRTDVDPWGRSERARDPIPESTGSGRLFNEQKVRGRRHARGRG